MSTEFGSLVGRQVSANMQSSMRDGKYSKYINHVGYELAQYFYYFLKGNINKLPDFSVIDRIIAERNVEAHDKILLSEGYGMLVRLDKGEIGIDYDEPITSKSVRRDVIERNGYKAQIIYDYEREPEYVNVNELPAFDIRRIRFLQDYLQRYRNYCESNEHKPVQR